MPAKTLRYNRFEKARIIGARALQVSLGAPVLVKVPKDMIDPIKISIMEFEKSMIPITVRRIDSIRDEGVLVEMPVPEIGAELEEAREKALERAEKAAQVVSSQEMEILKREKERREKEGEEPLPTIPKGEEDTKDEKVSKDKEEEDDDSDGL